VTAQAGAEEERMAAPPPADNQLQDATDRVLSEWQREWPDLAVAPVAIINRVSRLIAYLRPEVDAVFARHGLSNPSFSVLASLRRAGPPYQRTQRALMESLQLTSGTISVRIDRLEREGLVIRLPDPDDQRGVLVRLTEAGLARFEAVAPVHLANEERLLAALTETQREQFAALLRALLLSFELDQVPADSPLHPRAWLGATLAPAHEALRVRRAAGLSETPGLLVREVVAVGPAAEASLREGDLIVSVDGEELRAVAALYEHVQASRGDDLVLGVLRGVEPRTLHLHIPA
jgi:DNA-binding MarR family transcriptional regulator